MLRPYWFYVNDPTPSRLTLCQRWYRLRTSPRFPFFVLLGLLTSGVLVQVYYYWWDVRVVEMIARNKGYAERMTIYPDWLKKSLGHKFVRRFEPIQVVQLQLGSKSGADHRPGDIGLLRGALFLHELRLSGKLTDDDVKHLRHLTQLKTLGCGRHPEPAIDAIAELPNLTSLNLAFDAPPDPSAFRRLATMPRLQQLSIWHDIDKKGKTAEGLRELARSQTLYRLRVQVNNAEFLALTDPFPDGTLPWPALTELRISGSHRVAGQSLDNLKHLPNLIHLDLANWSITDEHLQALKQLPRLRTLYLEGNNGISDKAVDILLSMRTLQSINVKDTRMTLAGLLRLAKLPRLRCFRAHPGGLEAQTELRKLIPAGCELDTN